MIIIRKLIAIIINLATIIFALIILLFYKLISFFYIDKNKCFEYFSQTLSTIPFDFGVHIRRYFYKRTLKHCGKKFTTMFGVILTRQESIVGDNIYINKSTILGDVNIGNNTIISQHCSLLSGGKQHINQKTSGYIKLIIGNNVWIGANSVIMADIEDNAIIGAGSVVTKKVDHHVTVAGNPATIIKHEGVISS